ncbi:MULTISPECIES: CRISPR-associated protein Cas4 [Paenibacillus]|uniref:CRISPR-associated exonuclease Cas4 n=1 Tax=Paenibacillus pabuli TaxID=1472 RepID=A0A855YE34_9BACL|nr:MULTISPECIES: CRISPR-associated protein Cas4 [Paenibacillus]PWW44987.1 CRISPR-associated Cas4 family exonuclease [Paenibacillus pabuli]PXW11323.1 CRISPR-associated Cas4 family exonuclease [Paenibacillus taichungensis]
MKDYNEEDYLLLSGIQHFNFCRRQWALIHIEQQWEDNVRTIEGDHLHRKADQPALREKRGDKLVVRALPVQSRELGITGICDVVEFIRDKAGVPLAGEEGLYLPYPVEYKRGKPKRNDSDHSQLVAQVICLEEMLVCDIHKAYFYYDEIKHRVEVMITAADRERVRANIQEMRHYFERNHTPKAKAGPHCQSCSLNNICVPDILNKRSVSSYIESRLNE